MRLLKSQRIFAGFLLPVFILFLLGCSEKSDTKIIKLGHSLDTSHPVHKSMVYMGKRLEEKSGGSMRIDIYPNQQLGSERECLELLQIGSLGMAKVSSAVMENFSSEYKIFGLPYLFNSNEQRFRVLNSEIGDKFLNYPLDKRLKGLTFYDAGSRSFYTKKAVRTPQDLAGLKIRVMESQTAIKMVNILGGAATPISAGELYTALQQGIVDGAENNPPTFYASRQYEICQYFLRDEHTAIPDILVTGTPVWNKLSDQQKKWLKEAAKESAEYQKKLWREAELKALEEIKAAGVTVIEANKEEFRGKVQPMYDEFSKNPKMEQIIEDIQAVE